MSQTGASKNGRRSSSRASRVSTTEVESNADIRRFFDLCASTGFPEPHGDAERLLEYRLGLIRAHAALRPSDVVLDVGCGNGHHLVSVASEIRRGFGIDLSPGMIDLACARQRGSPYADRLSFEVDEAERLDRVDTASVDLALCIGAFEHMLDKPAVLRSIHRVLRPEGRFFCLTPDGAHVWYRAVAPLLRIATKHLSSDRFVTRCELDLLLAEADFRSAQFGSWTFIPRGDMPPLATAIFHGLGAVGRATRLGRPRGGLWACAWKDSRAARLERR